MLFLLLKVLNISSLGMIFHALAEVETVVPPQS